jgi:hypothetical protein
MPLRIGAANAVSQIATCQNYAKTTLNLTSVLGYASFFFHP